MWQRKLTDRGQVSVIACDSESLYVSILEPKRTEVARLHARDGSLAWRRPLDHAVGLARLSGPRLLCACTDTIKTHTHGRVLHYHGVVALASVDVATGAVELSSLTTPIGSPDDGLMSATVHHGHLVLSAAGVVNALALEGMVSIALPSRATSVFQTDQGALGATTCDGALYAIDLESRQYQLVDSVAGHSPFDAGPAGWGLIAKNEIRLYRGWSRRAIFAEERASVFPRVLAAACGVVLVDQSDQLTAIDENGRAVWSAEVDARVQTAAYHEGNFVVCDRSILQAFSASEGKSQWVANKAGEIFGDSFIQAYGGEIRGATIAEMALRAKPPLHVFVGGRNLSERALRLIGAEFAQRVIDWNIGSADPRPLDAVIASARNLARDAEATQALSRARNVVARSAKRLSRTAEDLDVNLILELTDPKVDAIWRAATRTFHRSEQRDLLCVCLLQAFEGAGEVPAAPLVTALLGAMDGGGIADCADILLASETAEIRAKASSVFR